VLVSYCPIGQGRLLDDPTIQRVAKEVGRSPAQVVLRWHMQQENVAAIPKSASRGHLEENLRIFDFALNDVQMKALSALAVPDGRIIKPPFAPAWD
jgi:diketogulonate reductase-like aldo/keto reductase